MWLLSTRCVELVCFDSPEEVTQKKWYAHRLAYGGVLESAVLKGFHSHWAKRKGYAILSHVWARDHSEKTYAEIAALKAEGVTSYDDSRVGSKIRESVRVAKKQGYGWIWNDTCCIDQRSSSALDEAINSMFRWYAEAAVCFAYLQDVPDDCSLEETNSHFRRSIWFTRGWTLQELLAPHFLLFFSKNWRCLGTKTGLASLVQEITGIEAEVLTLRRPLQDISVARRMSWASGRNTRRLEDRAYSLLGIFDVSMPTIYGEGSYAFRRLQVKIMKHHPDHTLFAWGNTWRPAGIDETAGPNKMQKSLTEPRPKSRNASSLLIPPLLDLDKSIFARSPSDFQHGAMAIISPSELIKRVKDIFDITIPSTTPVYEHAVTSSGVRCRFIIVHGKPFSLALLLCADDSQKCMALPLWAQAGDNHPQRYLTGVSIVGETYRLIPVCRATVAALNDLGWAPRRDAKPALGSPKAGVNGAGHRNGAAPRSGVSTPGLLPTAATQIIYIANIHPSSAQSCTPVLEHEPQKVCIPSWLVTHLSLYQLELEDSPHLDTAMDAPSELHIIHQKTPQAPERKLAFTIHFSQCVGRLTALVTFPPDPHAAPAAPVPAPRSVRTYAQVAKTATDAGDCTVPNPLGIHQHVSAWRNGSRRFVDGAREVQLSATRTPPGFDAYTLEIRLVGAHYASLRKARPSPPAPMSPTPTPRSTPNGGFKALPTSPRRQDSMSTIGSALLSSIFLQTPVPFGRPSPFNRAANGLPRESASEGGQSRSPRPRRDPSKGQ